MLAGTEMKQICLMTFSFCPFIKEMKRSRGMKQHLLTLEEEITWILLFMHNTVVSSLWLSLYLTSEKKKVFESYFSYLFTTNPSLWKVQKLTLVQINRLFVE